MYRTAIVDETGCVIFWCDEVKDEKQIKTILNTHPEWNTRCIEVYKDTEFNDNGCPKNCPCLEDYPDCYCQEILKN